MKAGLIMLGHLVRGASTIYPKLARSGERLRRGIERVFADAGVPARCTGYGNDVVTGSSLFMVHFPREAGLACKNPEEIYDDRLTNVALREEILKIALLVNGVNAVHGGGSVSVTHGDKEIDRTIDAYGESARLFKKYLY
jgi:glutamate-1-semialdehyde aminotransferase